MGTQQHVSKTTQAVSTTPSAKLLQTRPFQNEHEAENQQPSQLQAAESATSSFDLTTKTFSTTESATVSPAVPTLGLPLQAKLTIGEPNDKYEQEADRVAHDVVRRINAPNAVSPSREAENETLTNQPSQSIQRQISSLSITGGFDLTTKSLATRSESSTIGQPLQAKLTPFESAVQRKTQEENDNLQMKPLGLLQQAEIARGNASTDVEKGINSARGSGQSLAPKLQAQMGEAIGADFSGVRIHTDARSDQLNRSIGARAFTTGRDVFFKQGEYQPGSRGGQELIAHELTHVVQQGESKEKISHKAADDVQTYSSLDANVISRRVDAYDAKKLHQSSSYGSTYQYKKRGIRNLKDISDFQYDESEPSELVLYHNWADASKNFPAYTGDPSNHQNTPLGGFKRESQGESVACFWYGVRVPDAQEPTWKSPSGKNAWADYDHQPGVLSEDGSGYLPDPALASGHFHLSGMDREASVPGVYEQKLNQAGL